MGLPIGVLDGRITGRRATVKQIGEPEALAGHRRRHFVGYLADPFAGGGNVRLNRSGFRLSRTIGELFCIEAHLEFGNNRIVDLFVLVVPIPAMRAGSGQREVL